MEFQVLAKEKRKENKKYFRKLANKRPKGLDDLFHTLHEDTFEHTDCLTCANCCKTTSPLFTRKDIDRISGVLGLRPAEFTQQYLRIDEDGDYVFKSSPCPFLGEDNYCSIYEDRPKACREYPHTNRKAMYQILDITLENTIICPAVFEITERLKSILPPNEI